MVDLTVQSLRSGPRPNRSRNGPGGGIGQVVLSGILACQGIEEAGTQAVLSMFDGICGVGGVGGAVDASDLEVDVMVEAVEEPFAATENDRGDRDG